MIDLTKIEKPFGLLDKATQDALKAHFEGGGVVEMYGHAGWGKCTPAWCQAVTYRVAPEKHQVKLWVYLLEDGQYVGYDKPSYGFSEKIVAIKEIDVELTEGEGL